MKSLLYFLRFVLSGCERYYVDKDADIVSVVVLDRKVGVPFRIWH